ncbi:unnamed protein product [Paramecium sonneborni]|uniref:Uncharacterized protein n=1 Tax=Paramecium sonneborni TaxID=65129 RepID=A0A8S1NYA1_9CILI|nr:unnamed protein product [Paramecium sonneborni]
MLNTKEEFQQKFEKDKLHKNNYLRKAQKFASQDWRVDQIRSSLFVQDYSDLERSKIEQDLKKKQKMVLFSHFKYIANRIKERDTYTDKRKPLILLDYDFPLK